MIASAPPPLHQACAHPRDENTFCSPILSGWRNSKSGTDAGRPTTYDHANRVFKEALAAYDWPALAPAIEEKLAASSPAEGKREAWKPISEPPEKSQSRQLSAAMLLTDCLYIGKLNQRWIEAERLFRLNLCVFHELAAFAYDHQATLKQKGKEPEHAGFQENCFGQPCSIVHRWRPGGDGTGCPGS
jgi:hypothetical protein